jgi:hypothetical protein
MMPTPQGRTNSRINAASADDEQVSHLNRNCRVIAHAAAQLPEHLIVVVRNRYVTYIVHGMAALLAKAVKLNC